MMSVEKISINPELRDYIEYIWIFRSSTGIPATIHGLIVPNGKVKIVIPCISKIYTVQESDLIETDVGTVLFAGLRETAVSISTDETAAVNIVIELTFKGTYRFTRSRMSELTNRMESFADIFGKNGSVLERRLSEEADVKQKVNLIQEFLIERLNENRSNNLLVDYLIDRISSSLGLIKINKLPKETGYSNRYIRMLFNQHMGVSPKRFAEIVRFDKFHMSLIKKTNSKFFENMLYEYYFDQSHFIKTFKKFTGLTPKQYTSRDSEFTKIFYQ